MKCVFLSVFLLVSFFLIASSFGGCLNEERKPQSAVPNPAAVFCIEQGGRYEIKAGANGSQRGVCIWPDGTERDGWEFYREKHNQNK